MELNTAILQDINVQKLKALVQRVPKIIKIRMRYSSFIRKCFKVSIGTMKPEYSPASK